MLSSVELIERVRALTFRQRVLYSLSVAVAFVSVYLLALLLAYVLVLLLVLLLVGGPLTIPDDLITLGMPILVIFTFAIGLTGLGADDTMTGQTLIWVVRRAARSAFFAGLAAGALLGVLWGLIIRADPLLYALMMALSVAPSLAFFQGVAHVVETVCLRLVTRKS